LQLPGIRLSREEKSHRTADQAAPWRRPVTNARWRGRSRRARRTVGPGSLFLRAVPAPDGIAPVATLTSPRKRPRRTSRGQGQVPANAQQSATPSGCTSPRPEQASVLSVDEKPQFHGLDRTHAMLPLRPGPVERHTHDYKGNGQRACSRRSGSRPQGDERSPGTPHVGRLFLPSFTASSGRIPTTSSKSSSTTSAPT
jgi:hypothetical protein